MRRMYETGNDTYPRASRRQVDKTDALEGNGRDDEHKEDGEDEAHTVAILDGEGGKQAIPTPEKQ